MSKKKSPKQKIKPNLTAANKAKAESIFKKKLEPTVSRTAARANAGTAATAAKPGDTKGSKGSRGYPGVSQGYPGAVPYGFSRQAMVDSSPGS